MKKEEENYFANVWGIYFIDNGFFNFLKGVEISIQWQVCLPLFPAHSGLEINWTNSYFENSTKPQKC